MMNSFMPVSAYEDLLAENPTRERALKILYHVDEEIGRLQAAAHAREQLCAKIKEQYGITDGEF